MQKDVTGAQVQTISLEAIQAAKREHLELLAGDTGIDLEEMDTGELLETADSCLNDRLICKLFYILFQYVETADSFLNNRLNCKLFYILFQYPQ